MDRALVEQAQAGDRDAFAAIVRDVSDGLYVLAHRILRDPHLAQDAYQNAMIDTWKQLPRLRDPDRFEAWIHRILVYACYAESRRRTRWAANIRVLEIEGSRSLDDSRAVADRDELERGFRLLPVDQRAVFVLHHHIGLSLVEIADTLGIPAGTARSRLHYATRSLRRALEEPDLVELEGLA